MQGTRRAVVKRLVFQITELGTKQIARFASREDNDVSTADVLAAIDQAIDDSVDVLCLSIGFEAVPYYQVAIAIASLSAVEKGIFVACATRNDGNYNTTLNGVPWLTTVGAGTMDMSFKAQMTLENGLSMQGTTMYLVSIYISNATLYHGGSNSSKALCVYSSLEHQETEGKVIFCSYSTKVDMRAHLEELRRVGATAGALISDSSDVDVEEYDIPLLILQKSSGDLVKDYMQWTRRAVVKRLVFQITELGTKSALQIAGFSSRGSDPISPAILNPDILAPRAD